MPGNGLFPVKSFQQPGACGLGVGHRFEGGKSLRRDDEQGLFGVEVVCGLGEVRTVHVRDETEGHVPLAVVLQRFVGHDRPKIGAADADVNDVAQAFSAVSPPLPAANLLGEGRHPVQNGMHFGDDIRAVNQDPLIPWARAARCAERRDSP